MNARLEHRPTNFMSIAPEGTLVMIGVKDRAEFDRLALPVTDHGENENGHCLSKVIDAEGVYIVFQYWIKSKTLETLHEEFRARRAAQQQEQPS